MASTLYEPAFAVVSRRYDDPVARLRALAVITLCGGLASTVFLPLTGVLVSVSGWRVAVVVLAVLVALSTWGTDREVFRCEPHDTPPVAGGRAPVADGPAVVAAPLVGLLAVFGFTAFAAAAIIANLVPAMAERGISAPAAAVLGGAFGVMQLPGRALMLHGRLGTAPWGLLAASLGLQALGLGLWAIAPSAAAVVAGLALFAGGAGLATLVRPYLIQALFGTTRIGYLNGRLAQVQQLARAAGPVTAALAATAVTYSALFIVFAAIFCLFSLGAVHLHRRSV
jgi:hypothetical protein